MCKGIFIASNGQNVGKTTSCLGLFSGLKKRMGDVGFMKPVGQEHVRREDGSSVDKDVHLVKEHFHLSANAKTMSPVLFPSGFTRDYLDGKIDHNGLVRDITTSYQQLKKGNAGLLVEGTGHLGVGAIADLDNGKVASLLGIDIVMILSGGLGSSFDAFYLNKQLCDAHGVKIAGVILNRVLDDKREMVLHYMQKALNRFNVPILGCIPYDNLLSLPTMDDFATLLDGKILSGRQGANSHFADIRLIATSVSVFRKIVKPGMLVITPASREDIIQSTLEKHWMLKRDAPDTATHFGFILTGKTPPTGEILDEIRQADIPMIYSPISSYEAMRRIHLQTCKIRLDDTEKIYEAINLVESHIDFDRLIAAMR